MLFTRRSDYGLRAALELAANWGGPPVPAAELARRGDLPEPFARKALARLAAAGVARACRGRRGGYELARPPRQITVREILEPLQDLGSVDCMSDEGAPPCPLAESDACSTRRAWQLVQARLDAAMTALTLADLQKAAARPSAAIRMRGH